MTQEKIWEKDGYLLRPARVSDAEDYYAQNYDPLEPETARLTGCRAAFFPGGGSFLLPQLGGG